MASKNLWPSKATILSLGENAPSTILAQQAELLKEFNPSLYGKVIEAKYAYGTLSQYMFEDNYNPGIDGYYSTTRQLLAFKLIVGKLNISYKFDVVLIRFFDTELYPVEVFDVINSTHYNIPSREEFENCLSDIFSSPECLKKLRYILKA